MLVNEALATYLAQLAIVDDPVLREMEARAAESGFPIVGPEVGRLLYVLTVASGARRVLELGSGFGYSAWWFARGVGPGGLVVLTDRSSEKLADARAYLGRSGLGDRIRTAEGDALAVLEAEEGTFDIVFNDIDKERYPRVAAAAASRLRQGGLLVSDNMLWHGRVAEAPEDDAQTQGVLGLTRALYESGAWMTALLPVRDGVTVSVRL
jgi:caffeoyl-CoA O-methyltransferase